VNALESLVRSVDVVLFDFDGPVCRLFAGYAASDLADRLRALLAAEDVNPAQLVSGPDPLKLLRWTGANRPDLLAVIEDALIAGEVMAAKTAAPTAHAGEAIEAAAQSGRSTAVVSNNSADAIAAYLAAHRLADHISAVIGRAPGRPDRMKPDPEPVLRATAALGVRPEQCVLVGDSPTDIEAAQKAGTRSIGYAKHADRVSGLSSADAVIDDMMDLAAALVRFPRR
jgi:HAD superfamily hydrolase (TIGR01509 family)